MLMTPPVRKVKFLLAFSANYDNSHWWSRSLNLQMHSLTCIAKMTTVGTLLGQFLTHSLGELLLHALTTLIVNITSIT